MRSFLISPFAPWIISTVILIVGYVGFRFGRRRSAAWARWTLLLPSGLLVAVGVLLAVGTIFTAIKQASVRSANPPPGQIVEVGGVDIHVWCEGDNRDDTVLLISGGYSQALWFAHLKRDLEADYRTCLLDRAGLGWSEARPLEYGVESVLREIREALMAAGEELPITIVGHSFGGFYAANFAAKYPDDVKGIVLLDPTAPSHNVAMSTGGCYPVNYVSVLGSMFGLGFIKSLNPMYAPHMDTIRAAIGDDYDLLVAFESRPKSILAGHSALEAPCRKPLSQIPSIPGLLGDLPVLQVIQVPEEPGEDRPAWLAHLSDFEYENHKLLFEAASNDYLEMSTNSHNTFAPEGAGHNFPHTEREFTLEQIRGFLASPAKAGEATSE